LGKLSDTYTAVTSGIDLGLDNETLEGMVCDMWRPKQLVADLRTCPRFKEEFIPVAKRLAILGFSNTALIEYFQLPTAIIFNMWKDLSPEFKSAIDSGREDADCRVAEALLKLACGYEEEDVKHFHHKGDVIEHQYIKKYQPNISAIKMWLEARQSGIWKGADMAAFGLNLNVEAKDLDDGELDELIAKAGFSKQKSKISQLEEVK
jgi:hypothetical protein